MTPEASVVLKPLNWRNSELSYVDSEEQDENCCNWAACGKPP